MRLLFQTCSLNAVGSLSQHSIAFLLSGSIDSPHPNFLYGCTKISNNDTHTSTFEVYTTFPFHRSVSIETGIQKVFAKVRVWSVWVSCKTSPFYGIWYSSLIILKDQGFAWTVRKNLQNSLQVHGISSFSRKFEQIACKSLKRINLILSKLNCFSTLRMSILEQFEDRVQGYIL